MKKGAILSLILLVCLALLGLGYAHWQQLLCVNGTVNTGELDWEIVFDTVSCKDSPGILDYNCDDGIIKIRQVDKDVGWTSWKYVDTDGDGDIDELKVTLNNVYPCYYEHIALIVHNNGTIPIKIEKAIIDGNTLTKPSYLKLDLDGDGNHDMEMYWGNSFGIQMDPSDRLNLSFDLHILQAAPQGKSLTFTIKIVAVQWNK